MAMNGLSTNRRCEASASCLFDQGRRFVVRYHSRTTMQAEKRLHPREAAQLARAGLDIACVYQDRAREVEDFGAARGEQDAISALTYAGQVGQPAGSAVYFAVDADFSAAQIQSAVVPYFRSVERVFAQAGGGTRYLSIGVYGSGLTCRLIGQLPFVAFTWLAEATGWRESSTFSAWSIRQHVNSGQVVVRPGPSLRRLRRRAGVRPVQAGGLRRPVGPGRAAHCQGRGRQPAPPAEHPLQRADHAAAAGPRGARARALRAGLAAGAHVARRRRGHRARRGVAAGGRGHAGGRGADRRARRRCRSRNCAKTTRPRIGTPRAAARFRSASWRGRPATRTPVAAARIGQLQALADWLGVESSERYARTPTLTFCNVYAADYCYLADAYLPRVWWTDSALLRLGAGEQVPVRYGDTVREMRADDLFAWLVDMGPRFGWRRVFDATALQDTANGGGVGLICADRAAEGRPGHITVVVPEDAAHHAVRDADGHVVQPLQTQAGAVNRRFGSAGANWWLGSEFRDRGFFTHR